MSENTKTVLSVVGWVVCLGTFIVMDWRFRQAHYRTLSTIGDATAKKLRALYLAGLEENRASYNRAIDTLLRASPEDMAALREDAERIRLTGTDVFDREGN